MSAPSPSVGPRDRRLRHPAEIPVLVLMVVLNVVIVAFILLYRVAREFADRLGLRRRPDLFLTNGNGQLNAFAAQAARHDYVVLSNELFANLDHGNREGLLGQALSRLREYSCDRHGAYLEPHGQTGLVLLASGRYTERDVDVEGLLNQTRNLRGFWVTLAQLVRSHPFTVRRLEQLYRVGLFAAARTGDTPPGLHPARGGPAPGWR